MENNTEKVKEEIKAGLVGKHLVFINMINEYVYTGEIISVDVIDSDYHVCGTGAINDFKCSLSTIKETLKGKSDIGTLFDTAEDAELFMEMKKL